jgi:hypothetical protein
MLAHLFSLVLLVILPVQLEDLIEARSRCCKTAPVVTAMRHPAKTRVECSTTLAWKFLASLEALNLS